MNDYLPINFFIRSTTSLGCDTASLANASSSCPVVGLISRGVMLCFDEQSRVFHGLVVRLAENFKAVRRHAGRAGEGAAKFAGRQDEFH